MNEFETVHNSISLNLSTFTRKRTRVMEIRVVPYGRDFKMPPDEVARKTKFPSSRTIQRLSEQHLGKMGHVVPAGDLYPYALEWRVESGQIRREQLAMFLTAIALRTKMNK